MKRTIIFFTFLIAVMTVMAQRPHHYGDTIIPETCTEYLFQMPWWGEHWINADSTRLVWEAVRDSVYYNSEEDHGHILIGDWVRHNVTHQVKLWDYGNYNRGEHMHLFENSRLIKITGISIAQFLATQWGGASCDTVAPYPDSAEYVTCYLKGEVGYPVRQQVKPWTFDDSCRYLRFETKGMHGVSVCCEDKTRDTLYLPVYEHFFDEPVYTDDGFYLGTTNFSDIAEYGCTRACLKDWEGGCIIDTCPRLYTSYYHRGARNINDTNIGWGLITGWNRAPLIFAIYEPCDCPGAMNLHVAGIHGDTARIAWNPSAYVSGWEVSYGREGDALSGYTTALTDTNTFSFVLPDSNRYSVRVRARCGSDSAIYSDWSAMRTVYLTAADTAADSSASIVNVSANDGISLLPNPADRQVTVSAALPLLHVEVYDLAGRLVETHHPSGTALQLDLKSYPSGTYLVKVTTATGTTTKKLVVK